MRREVSSESGEGRAHLPARVAALLVGKSLGLRQLGRQWQSRSGSQNGVSRREGRRQLSAGTCLFAVGHGLRI